VLGAQSPIVDVAAFDPGEALVDAAIDHQHLFRRELGDLAGFVEQVLVGHGLATAHAGIGGDDQLGLRVVDTRRQRAGGKAAEYHRVDGADAGACEDGEGRFGDHRHVDQYAVALADAQALHHRGHAHHFGLQLAEGVGLFDIRLGRNEDQRRRIRPLGGMPVDGVVAEIGLAAGEPFDERRLRVVADLLRRLVPVDQLCLLAPEGVRLLD
jgi:hypothetical protein